MSVLGRMFRIETAWGLAFLMVVVAISLFTGFRLRDGMSEGPPIILRDDTRMVGQAESGGTLYLSVHRIVAHPRPPVCDGATDRVLWRPKRALDGVWEREIAPFTFRGVADPFPNESRFQLDLPIDAQIDPGLYWFTVFFYQPCDIWIRFGFAAQKIYPSLSVRIRVTKSSTGRTQMSEIPSDALIAPPAGSLDTSSRDALRPAAQGPDPKSEFESVERSHPEMFLVVPGLPQSQQKARQP